MALPSQVNGSKVQKTGLSDQEAYSVLSTVFVNDVDPNSPTATLLNINGAQRLAEAYRERVSTKQIGMYLNGSTHSIEVWESLLRDVDKELVRAAKLSQSIDSLFAIESEIDDDLVWLGRLDESVKGKGLEDEADRADLVRKRMKARELKVKIRVADVDRYTKAAEKKQSDDDDDDVYITQMIVSNAWLDALPDD